MGGRGFKRVSDCPLGDEAVREMGWGGEKNRGSTPYRPSLQQHCWLPPRSIGGRGGGAWMKRGGGAARETPARCSSCLLTQQTQQGAFHLSPCQQSSVQWLHRQKKKNHSKKHFHLKDPHCCTNICSNCTEKNYSFTFGPL